MATYEDAIDNVPSLFLSPEVLRQRTSDKVDNTLLVSSLVRRFIVLPHLIHPVAFLGAVQSYRQAPVLQDLREFFKASLGNRSDRSWFAIFVSEFLPKKYSQQAADLYIRLEQLGIILTMIERPSPVIQSDSFVDADTQLDGIGIGQMPNFSDDVTFVDEESSAAVVF
jgi:hypothetical protein